MRARFKWHVFLSLSLGFAACGADIHRKKPSSGGDNGTGLGADENPPPPSPPAPPKPPAVDTIHSRLYIASSASRTIAMYKMDGTFVGFIDLTSTGSGFVTAMTWLDKNTMLAFFDPGSSGERIAKISFSSDANYTINGSWYTDSVNLSGVSVTKMFSLGFTQSPVVLIAKNTGSLEAIFTNSAYSLAARSGSPYINSQATCPLTTTAFVSKNPAGDRTIIASNGTNARLNVYASDKSCLGSYNFATSFPGATSFSVTGLVATKDSVFVRYQSSTSPMIVKCAFDGTTISACGALVNDVGALGVNASSKELVMDEASSLLYFPNWDTGAVMQVNAVTGYVAPFVRDVFTTNVGSISIRPQ